MRRRAPLFIVLLAAVGCADRGPATVAGKVTLNGVKIPSGTVAFHPQTAGTTPVYIPISEDGRYDLANQSTPTIPAGSYVVTVSGCELPEQKPGVPGSHGKLITPEKYGGKDTSPLRAEVKPGANTIDFDVKPE
jgi:hypothetical protein